MKIILLPLLTLGLGLLRAQETPAPLAEGQTPGQVRTDNAAKLPLRWCPPGTFVMGSPADEPQRDDYEQAHNVTLTQGFWMAETETTQGQFLAILDRTLRDQVRRMLADEALYPFNGKQITLREAMKAADGDKAVDSVYAVMTPNVPIYYVSWDDATECCEKFTTTERDAGRLPPGWHYALPTEAQWEYACRAATTTATYAGPLKILGENNAPILDKIAWYGGNSSVDYKGAGWTTKKWPNQAHPGKFAGPRRVGQKAANPWGLRDMLGNLYEWVADYSALYGTEPVTDPQGPATGQNHPYRGGAWNHYAAMCRAAKSFEAPPTYRTHYLGFRIALVPDAPHKP